MPVIGPTLPTWALQQVGSLANRGREMRPDVFWIHAPLMGRLAIMPRPRAGEWLEDEIIGWQMEGIDTVVSLLELAEISELGLEREAELSREHGIEFICFPIPDRGLPTSLRDAATLAQTVALQVREGRAVAIHCRAGIGRSSLIAAGVLICSGLSADDAFRLISIARGIDVPDTEAQREWAMAFGEAMATGA
jgi:protein-tyrosine phosphatase